jgi:hypothetical protein
LAAAVIPVSCARQQRPAQRGDEIRRQAIRRGLEFLYQTATQPANFDAYSDDYLWCFRCIGLTSADPELRNRALAMGQERARLWRRQHPHLPAKPSADDIYAYAYGSYSADTLGVPDPGMREEIRRAALQYTAVEYLGYDPAKETVPDDIPQPCPKKCGTHNPRGARVCRRDGTPLTMVSRYDLLCDALIGTYTGDRYGVWLGGHYADVVRSIPLLRPYPAREGGKNPEWEKAVYTITHLIYTMNDYSVYRLRPEWFPQEFAFLKTNLRENLATGDSETMGEFLDTLKSLGMTGNDPLIRTGVDFLLAHQNADGSWGDMREKDIYNRYHPTWTAVDGLRDYAWSGEGVSFPEAFRRLQSVR